MDKQIDELRAMVAAKGVTIELDPAARAWLAAKGFDRAFGARPMARLIERVVKKPLSEALLFGALADGGAVRIVVEDDEIRWWSVVVVAPHQSRTDRMTSPTSGASTAASRSSEAAVRRRSVRAVRALVRAGARRSRPIPTAMALATATRDGRPSVRTVLLKGVDERGFVFYTNYDSRKAREIDADRPRQPAVLLARRSSGRCASTGASRRSATPSRTPTSRRGRSRAAGACTRRARARRSRAARRSSRATTSRAQTYGDAVPRPPWWGGYRVVPDEFEFWQGRASRLHDRLQYRKQADGSWMRERLAP